MNKKLLESALTNFLLAWKHKSIDEVVNLLSDSFNYYESPLDEPLTTPKQIRELWASVPKFKADITLAFDTLVINDDFGLFRIKGNYAHTYEKDNKVTKIDRIFLLSIDDKGKITKFMQWRESKDF